MDKLRTMFGKQKIGKIGEKLAENYLRSKNYQILERNFWVKIGGKKFGEIDIVAKKNNKIIFFEIKTSSRGQEIFPEEKVNLKKIQKIQQTAEIWLEKNHQYHDLALQIDVLAIVLNFETRTAQIAHFQNIA